jgi:hypothetical protein
MFPQTLTLLPLVALSAAVDVDCWLLVLLLLRLLLIVEPLSRQTATVTVGGWTINSRPVERPTHLLSSSVCSGG